MGNHTRKAAESAAKAQERETVKQRNEGANEDFQLGQSAEDNLSGQRGMFSRSKIGDANDPTGVRIESTKDGEFTHEVTIDGQAIASFATKQYAERAAARLPYSGKSVGVSGGPIEKQAGRAEDAVRRLERDTIKSVGRANALIQKHDKKKFCYALAARAAFDGFGDYQIGLIRESGETDAPIIWHAIVKMADGRVFNPTFGKIFAPAIYEQAFGFKPAVSMSADQVGAFSERTGKIFPDAENLGLASIERGNYSRAQSGRGMTKPALVAALSDTIARTTTKINVHE